MTVAELVKIITPNASIIIWDKHETVRLRYWENDRKVDDIIGNKEVEFLYPSNTDPNWPDINIVIKDANDVNIIKK